CPTPVDGQIATVTVRGRDLELRSIALAVAGGSFHGEGRLRDLARYTVDGEIAGFAIRRTVAMYSAEPLPWDGRASGKVHLEGSFRQKNELRLNTDLVITPAPEGAPV